ncbi:hypothetical protein, partial [Oenococcus oeni]|uniref:hypothetical protein n=1 Tax=Oenococcus oeni TaxID=1247 RepID=UPI001C5AD144
MLSTAFCSPCFTSCSNSSGAKVDNQLITASHITSDVAPHKSPIDCKSDEVFDCFPATSDVFTSLIS